VDRAQRLLQEAPTTGADLPPLRAAAGTVTFNDVTFGYTPGTTVLDGVSFQLRAGESTALVRHDVSRGGAPDNVGVGRERTSSPESTSSDD